MIGRETELARAEETLRSAGGGVAAVLVLCGEAGIGKSTVLAAAGTRADALGFTLARVTGVQAEHDVPYAGLHALLSPLLTAGQARLPPPGQLRDALEVALGRATGPAPGRLAVGAATLAVLGSAEPLCVLVDDLPWVDPPSADALAFAARRLGAERVCLLATVRTTDAGSDSLPPVAAGLPRLTMRGLADPSGLLVGCHPTVVRRLQDLTGGNPLALLEAAASLTAEQRSGESALPRQLPPTNPEQAFAVRLDELPPVTRDAVRLAALAGSAPYDVLVAALAVAGRTLADLDAAVAEGVCTVERQVHWRHPLARSAAARGTPGELRTGHRALAEAWSTTDSPAGAWHRAEAAEGPDADAAAALCAVAEAAAAQDASADAADAWERAAGLTPSPAERVRLLERAGRAALRAGLPRRAAALVDDALLRQPGPEAAARLLWQRGRIQHGLGDPERCLELFVQAVGLSTDPDVRVWAAAEGLFAAMYARRPDQATRMATLVASHHDPADPVHRFLVAHAAGAAHALNERPEEARTAMAPARAALADGLLDREPELLLWAVNLELFDPLVPALTPALRDALDRARSAGDLTWLPRVTHLAATRQLLAGHWTEGVALVEECELLSRVSGEETQLLEALIVLAEVDALRGTASSATDRLNEARDLGERIGVAWLATFVRQVEALVRISQDELAAAADLLRSAVADEPSAIRLLLDCVLRDLGQDAARAELSRHPDLPAAEREIAEAMLDPDEERGGRRLRRAADEEVPLGVDASMLRLAAGERLRRAGCRREAREELRRTLAHFEALGAEPWARRTEAELRASGATLRRRDLGSALTPSELRVASLAAEGRSTKEVATALFLSPKTVEFHLGNVYRKLGVGNRVALAQALGMVDA